MRLIDWQLYSPDLNPIDNVWENNEKETQLKNFNKEWIKKLNL